ncbi:MAG: hypothetical protein KZQ95_22140 [Candidatus Thiodiazotropha sp. (ex Epidulcina cf. delphinae)]|nr:hypothetical protein [Candidatus Thiodiazotropha sp. (ex Epidulcina cf. delphinae)]
MLNLYKVIFLLLMMLSASYTYASSSPDETAKLLIQAIEENNLKKYESLIYPASLKFYKERDAKNYKRQMELRFKRKKPSQYNSYEISITDIINDKDSNKEEKRLRFYKNKWMKFPIEPEKRLNIVVKEGNVKAKGEWTVPYMLQVLSKHNGKWYVVLPTEFIDFE